MQGTAPALLIENLWKRYDGKPAVEGLSLGVRMADLSRRLDLESAKRDLVVTYSKGMRQKLAFAASVIHGPRLLIVDEPLIGVDPAGQHAIKEEVRAVTRLGGSVVVSTHMLDTPGKRLGPLAVWCRGGVAGVGGLAG